MEIITNVDKNTANAYLYGFNNDRMEYFRSKYDILKNSLADNAPRVNLGFINNLDYMASDKYMVDVKNKLLELNMAGADDTNIYYYKNPNEANSITRKYIMSNPMLINLHNKGLIEGYSESYVHDEIDALNKYATVMDGELHEDNNFVTYLGYDLEDISEHDKEIVRMNWDMCKKLLKDDIDPTAT